MNSDDAAPSCDTNVQPAGTLDEPKLSHSPPKKSRLRASLMVAVLSVAFGTNFGIYNTSVVNNLKTVVVRHINETEPAVWLRGVAPTPDHLWALVVSAFLAGSAFGTLCAPAVAEFFGRRIGLLISAALNIIGGLMCAFYLYVFELSIFGRLLMGFSLGLGIPLASSFITEISPVDRRGQLNAVLQTAFGLGDLCGMLFSTSAFFGTLQLSVFALSFTLILSIVQFLVICVSYDSPRYLILKRRLLLDGKLALQYYQGKEESLKALDEIMSENQPTVDNTLVNTTSMSGQENLDAWSFRSTCSYFIKKPLLLACLLLTTNALTGISPVMAFSTDAYLENGVPHYVEFCTVVLGLSNLVGSLVAISLTESLGRKLLLAMGLIGCFCSITFYTVISLVLSYHAISPYWSYGLVTCLAYFLLFFSLFGAASNTLAAEICPQTYRSLAVSLANFCLMFFSTILILLYQVIKTYVGYQWVFFPFSALSMLTGLYLFRAVPETKNKSLSEIKKHFDN